MATQTKTIHYNLATNLRQFKKRRVAVYARVSRESEVKHLSIEAQKKHLKEDINMRPDWEFVDFYVDEGITGTRMDRPEFSRMMKDARDGKLDIILTKSVSRFGRNYTAVQTILQELIELGVIVIFNSENIRSDDPDAMLCLQFLGIQAEAEAKQTSDYQKWAIRTRFQMGIPTYARPYGYKMKDLKLNVIPEEAEVVKRIFDMYLSGMGRERICRQLTNENIPSPTGVKWRESTICGILRNEKYTGNMMLQKWYVQDFKTKLGKRNCGELPMYLVEDTHEPIITKEIFEATQEEIKRRSIKAKKKTKNYKPSTRLFSQLLYCGYCGNSMHYKFSKGNGTKRDLWVCEYHTRLGRDACPTKCLREYVLKKATYEVLLSNNLIKENSVLTHELLKEHIYKIIVLEDQQLEYHLRNDSVVTQKWEYESRSKSWTSEMRKRARERTLKQFGKEAR